MAIAILVAVADQITKWWLDGVLQGAGGRIVLAPFLNLVAVYNTGISFGLLVAAEARWTLVVFTVAVVGALGVWLWRGVPALLAAALGLVMGGALGNLIDRAAYGAVFDFLDLHVAGFHWPAFNLADAAITVGAGLVLLDATLKREPRGAK
ncbi:MAG: signal peptidase II [Alphaproteobacteria bacterium]|nr:signal peptidase II [Alphaproteobacteria bacterium]